MDIHPVNPGHVLVIPTRHAPYLADLDPAIAGRVMQEAQRIAAAIRASGVRCEGVNLFLADGEAAMQEVFTCTCTCSRDLPVTALVYISDLITRKGLREWRSRKLAH